MQNKMRIFNGFQIKYYYHNFQIEVNFQQLESYQKMGQQNSRLRSTMKQQTSSSPWSGRVTPKTDFHYIHPIKCELQQNLQCDELGGDEETDSKTNQAQYWEIQNNQEDAQINTIKDLQKIEEIKVKWNQFIKMKKRNYLQDYSVLKQIGRGGFGCVHKVKARYTGLLRAAKRIKKAQLKKAQHQKLFQQMAIMMSLDHPNIIKLYEVYDYKSYYVLIMELCQGGQLFKKIVTKQLNQDLSSRIMKQLLWTLIYLHKRGIVHRDLKPQNMLFETDSDIIKIIDFGIAVKKKPNQILTARLGTPYYIAPEVLCKNYGEKCDVWSAGVILFMMISGYPPFRGDNEYEVMESVLKEPVMFKGTIWTKVTSECKNLIGLMLRKNPQQRPTAQQAFNHPWIKKVIQSSRSLRQQNVIANIRDFSFDNKLQAVVYTYIVSQLLNTQEKKFLIQTFKELDKNNDGVISSAELAEALRQRKDLSQQRLKFLVRVIDTNGSGLIDYTEFLVAGLNPKITLNQSHFEQAFQYFDIDHSGAITFEEIAFFLQNTKESQQSIKRIFQQVDENGDGSISKEEFVKLLMHQTKKKLSSIHAMNESEQDKETKRKTKTNVSTQSSSVNQPSKSPSQSQKMDKNGMPDKSSQTSSVKSKRISSMVIHEKGTLDRRQKTANTVKQNHVPILSTNQNDDLALHPTHKKQSQIPSKQTKFSQLSAHGHQAMLQRSEQSNRKLSIPKQQKTSKTQQNGKQKQKSKSTGKQKVEKRVKIKA